MAVQLADYRDPAFERLDGHFSGHITLLALLEIKLSSFGINVKSIHKWFFDGDQLSCAWQIIKILIILLLKDPVALLSVDVILDRALRF